MNPETRYPRSGAVDIAYQVVGDVSRDIGLGRHRVNGVPGEWQLFALELDGARS